MHQHIRAVAQGMALCGGGVLCLLIGLTCLSILGREFGALWPESGLGPITGDFELVEAGMAFVVFAFLPLTHLDRGHAVVDLFVTRWPIPAQRVLAALIEALFALVLVLIAVQLFAGLLSKKDSGQTSFLLQFPVWWGYAAAQVGATLSAFVGIYMALLRLAEAVTGRPLLPQAPGEAL